jgi:hypothetical protein
MTGMRTLTICLALATAGLAASLPPAQAHYDSNARRLCVAERIQMGPHAFAHRYGGRGAMWRCLHDHSSVHQASVGS